MSESHSGETADFAAQDLIYDATVAALNSVDRLRCCPGPRCLGHHHEISQRTRNALAGLISSTVFYRLREGGHLA